MSYASFVKVSNMRRIAAINMVLEPCYVKTGKASFPWQMNAGKE